MPEQNDRLTHLQALRQAAAGHHPATDEDPAMTPGQATKAKQDIARLLGADYDPSITDRRGREVNDQLGRDLNEQEKVAVDIASFFSDKESQ